MHLSLSFIFFCLSLLMEKGSGLKHVFPTSVCVISKDSNFDFFQKQGHMSCVFII